VSAEVKDSFDCFGGRVTVSIRGAESEVRLREARETLLDAHRRLSRFDPESELSLLNRDPRTAVPASPLLRRLALAAYTAGALSGGLVDATLLEEIERLGYVESLEAGKGPDLTPGEATAPARPSRKARWCSLAVDEEAGRVVRPPGTKLDGGGIAKGLLADIVGEQIGGSAGLARSVGVQGPFGEGPIHELCLQEGAVATSGISRRTWLAPGALPAHQILNPATGLPAMTGLVQVTAVAPTALHAEIFAKAALLSGLEGAAPWLPFGGVLVLDGGEVEVVAARVELSGAVRR
jgi:thiamine biosynthesis lipoprotein